MTRSEQASEYNAFIEKIEKVIHKGGKIKKMGKRKLSTKAQEYSSKQLHQAIINNDIEIVKAVLEHGADVNARG